MDIWALLCEDEVVDTRVDVVLISGSMGDDPDALHVKMTSFESTTLSAD